MSLISWPFIFRDDTFILCTYQFNKFLLPFICSPLSLIFDRWGLRYTGNVLSRSCEWWKAKQNTLSNHTAYIPINLESDESVGPQNSACHVFIKGKSPNISNTAASDREARLGEKRKKKKRGNSLWNCSYTERILRKTEQLSSAFEFRIILGIWHSYFQRMISLYSYLIWLSRFTQTPTMLYLVFSC